MQALQTRAKQTWLLHDEEQEEWVSCIITSLLTKRIKLIDAKPVSNHVDQDKHMLGHYFVDDSRSSEFGDLTAAL